MLIYPHILASLKSVGSYRLYWAGVMLTSFTENLLLWCQLPGTPPLETIYHEHSVSSILDHLLCTQTSQFKF